MRGDSSRRRGIRFGAVQIRVVVKRQGQVSTLRVLSSVNVRFEAEKTSNDDQQHCYDAIVDSLTDERRDIFLRECDIADSLEREYGLFNVAPEMYERDFAEAGIE